MEVRISATDLARKLAEVLERVGYRREVFVIDTSVLVALARVAKNWEHEASPCGDSSVERV